MKHAGVAEVDRLKQRRGHLMEGFLEDREPDFLKEHTLLLDTYFNDRCETVQAGFGPGEDRIPYAVVALGGYGRGEQCIHSDVDLLILFGNGIPDAAERLVADLVYPLWDIGLHVSHTIRTLREPIAIPEEDVQVLTALLDARFVCGMSPLFAELMKKFRREVIALRTEAFVDRLVRTNRERHIAFGDSSFLLEPNLKEGRGGLRDYHTIMWVARIQSEIHRPRDLEFYGYLSYEEFREMSGALSFIWRVRNHLHHLAGRKYDQLHFDYQEQVAKRLGYEAEDGQQPVERFLGDLHEQMNFIKHLHDTFVYALEHRNVDGAHPGKTAVAGIEVKGNMLGFTSPERILAHRELLIRIFEESARLRLPLSLEAGRLVRSFLHLVDTDFRSSPEMVAAFERVLVSPTATFNVLNEMLNTGFLVRFIPRFRTIVHRIQYDEYHLYPVDKHSLRTVRILKAFGTGEDPTRDALCGELYRELDDRKTLLWAALLHDIGKGEPDGNHSEKGADLVRGVLAEKGYDEGMIDTVSFLVREHLLLAKTAARRDIQDEETAILCARRIGEVKRLKMVYLLTVADSIATGPKAWNSWSLSLMQGLYLNVLNTLERGELATSEAVEMVEKKKEAVRRSFRADGEREAADSVLKVMSPRYLLQTPIESMVDHIALFRSMGDRRFAWKIERIPDASARKVTVCAGDCPGLFSKISGAFTLNGVDILNAQIYTWRNNHALDIFRVKPPPDRIYEVQKWEKIREDVLEALAGRIDLGAQLRERLAEYGYEKPPTLKKPHRVEVDNETSTFFTIIEVFTWDFPGLLFLLTDALFRCRLDVWLAKIATQVDQVVDVFYVRDFDGQKVEAGQQVAEIKRTVEAVLP